MAVLAMDPRPHTMSGKIIKQFLTARAPAKTTPLKQQSTACLKSVLAEAFGLSVLLGPLVTNALRNLCLPGWLGKADMVRQ